MRGDANADADTVVARAECKRASALLVTPDRTFFGLGVPFCTDVSQLLAGKIEPFESPQDAVCREIHEETGGFVTAETVKHGCCAMMPATW